jgi:histidyl-tRNA synthetase
MNYQKQKGTADFLPEQTKKWQFIEDQAKSILSRYQFKEIRTPIFEQFELFARGVGETSDIVSKEMYDFYDKGERHIALRPEGTAGVVRAFVENKMYAPEHHKPLKYYYIGPMFRYERPQSGRMRQFHQLGVEVFGSTNPATDVEVMALAMDLFQSFGLKNLKLVINSLGSTQTRKEYRQALIDYLEPHFDELSEDSKNRLHKNPLRVLDSKDKKDKELVADAPSVLDYLDEASKAHFEEVKEQLEALGIAYEIDTNMVRGLDYYNDTIFEIMTEDPNFGSNTTICAGGRYDGLVEEVGGPQTPGFGFGCGLERLVMLLEGANFEFPELDALDAYIVTIGKGDAVNREATKLAYELRKNGLNIEREFLGRKPGSQFKSADKLQATLVFTLGERELEEGTVNAKYLANGKEMTVKLDEFYNNEQEEIIGLVENIRQELAEK